MTPHVSSDLQHILHELGHFLPAQSPLKDFVHHNTLHAFQHLPFHEALQTTAENFGYKTYLSVESFRDLYAKNKINEDILDRVILSHKGPKEAAKWKDVLLHKKYKNQPEAIVGRLRIVWKNHHHVNLDKETHTTLFRMLGSYLDQGIAIWKFPVPSKGFVAAVRNLESNSFSSLFKSQRAKNFLLDPKTKLEDLLDILVGSKVYFRQYLFDQQFAHPGWSGMVAVLEHQPQSLLDKKTISLHDLIFIECLLEIDALDRRLGDNWDPLAKYLPEYLLPILTKTEEKEYYEVLKLWQEAFEWTYFDQVIRGLQLSHEQDLKKGETSFQAVFCIDDRCCSIRRYIERFAPDCQTFGTAGFFNIPFFFQPEHSKFMTKVCPAPVTPIHVIRESEAKLRHEKDSHFSKHTKGIFGGWAISQTMGFLSAAKMAKNIFRPGPTPAMVSSFSHMDPNGKLSIECKSPDQKYHGLQVGFTLEEMTNSLEGLLKGIGLVKDFAPLVYIFGHGASSVNNTHYAGYDCGACSGRAGSVNARVGAYFGNHPEVRKGLEERGISIPTTTQFVGGLHDTTRDEMEFYDLDVLTQDNVLRHQNNLQTFGIALDYNAKERSRRFDTIDSSQEAAKVHEKVKLRALSLFEPRPEWNHATNALCVIGKRENNKHLFLDKRAFLNSYDYGIDPEGNYLLNIVKAVAPVCGGINLEYYFSSVDNQRLGAGSKLPHNVMGLIGVANGLDGDLRPGLPKQMVNIHDPLRILITVEHFPDIVLKTIKTHDTTYEWFANEWVRLVAIHPKTKEAFLFKGGKFISYQPLARQIEKIQNLDELLVSTSENLPVYLLS
ncbi:DUF2309 domain-containing protein [Aquiflexum sp. TKW24L]|uniref:YbcC family protein n=1 Tax=Aquiflexum sp. TKW24L TaxID=2942212 RepID=UPI0020C0404D|nr:DUF2309 domain-containing protein [Aquiflexum sp. TKW24L]MCL6261680.1 DUF2309 domain-containing protein [Aquiflexum sp. TKW24L]